MTHSLIPTPSSGEELRDLRREIDGARRKLNEAESLLSQEQAAINAFRMQCRLKLGELIDRVLELQERQQTLLVELELWRQGMEPAGFFNTPPPEDPTAEELQQDVNLPLPDTYATARDRQAEKRLFRELARRFHPDLAAGTAERAYATAMMAAVNNAYTSGDVEALRDMAGELDPAEVASLSRGGNRQVRRLRKRLLKMRRRRRKALHQLHILRQDKTAQLWRRARELEAEQLPWWVEVQAELSQAIERLQRETEELANNVAAQQEK